MNRGKDKETDTTGELIATNLKLSVLSGAIFLVIVLILPVLNEYARSLMLTHFHGFTVTYIYTAIFIIVSGWIIALNYILKIDRMEEEYNDR
jgi:uncharacterized membrane protein (DUF485 family)